MTKEEILAKLKFDVELRGLSKFIQDEYLSKAKLFQDHFAVITIIYQGGISMDYKSVLEEQIRELQKAQDRGMTDTSILPPFVCEISEQILEIINELRVHNYLILFVPFFFAFFNKSVKD